MRGFKSFAQKTKITFSDGLTGFVGPNGCGKTNIVDAIRWVLGEQKAGLLRSNRMENVIFDGTSTRRPLGMAEVSLTIENTRNILPIEYGEVEIIRRLFRSGESQYLLNRSPCRLKDIVDLFMDTGMGSDAYSIIELKMVEDILKPEGSERRRLIEEAAGVTKYKERRRAAQRKLITTEQDLVRVGDIISEVKRNVISLKRQAGRAERVQKLKEELKASEIRLAQIEFARLTGEGGCLKDRIVRFQDEELSLAARISRAQEGLEKWRTDGSALEAQGADHQATWDQISRQIHHFQNEMLISQERIRALKENSQRLRDERERLKKRVEEQGRKVTELGEKIIGLDRELTDLETLRSPRQDGLMRLGRELGDLRNQAQGARERNLDLLRQAFLKEGERVKLQSRVENIEHLIARLKAEGSDLEGVIAAKENELEGLRHTLVELLGRQESLAAEMRKVSGDLKVEEEKQIAFGERHRALQQKVGIARAKIDFLNRLVGEKGDPSGAAFLLKRRLSGIQGRVGDLIEVPPNYRRAVEAALGPAAWFLVVRTITDALKCIALLKKEQKPGVTFIVLDKFATFKWKAPGVVSTKSHSGVHGWGKDLVSCLSQYRSVVEFLLGDVLVVADLSMVHQFQKRKGGDGVRWVTMDGEVIQAAGGIIGWGGASPATLWDRKQQSQELGRQIQTDTAELNILEGKIEKHKAKQEGLRAREKELKDQLEVLGTDRSDAGLKQSTYRLEMDRAREALKSNREEGHKLHQELKQVRSELSRTDGELGEIRQQREDLETRSAGLFLILEEKEADQKRAASDLQELDLQLIRKKGERENFIAEQERRNEIVREAESILLDVRGREKASASEEETLLKDVTERELKLAELSRKLGLVEEKKARVADRLGRMKDRIAERERGIAAQKEKRTEIRERIHGLELELSGIKGKAEALRDRIRREFQVDLETLKAPAEGEAPDSVPEITRKIDQLRQRLDRAGPVNLLALEEYKKAKKRLDFLIPQRQDLLEAKATLRETIVHLDKTARKRFKDTLDKIHKNFQAIFADLFDGGEVELHLGDGDPLEAQIEIAARPKGKRLKALNLLSGGEKALTATALLFAIYMVKPSPFCILDEVDAPLDDANIDRFLGLLRRFYPTTQFILVTHNKKTMEAADSLYGVTMEEEGVSKVVSVKFE